MPANIYIGYMDEEVASLLKFMLENNTYQRILLFERGLVRENDEFLLERPMATFQNICDQVKIKIMSLEELFGYKKGSGKYYDFHAERINRRVETHNPRKVTSEIISIVEFVVNDGKIEDTAFVIHTAEMGKQPALVRLYLRLLLRYLKVECDIQEVNLYSYGAGGGILTGSKPGKIRSIKGSVFVGPDINELGERFPNVELVYQNNLKEDGENPKFSRSGSHSGVQLCKAYLVS